ncbi:FAD-linked oxidase [Streptacidiphilus pinicola]|uniref:FAD-linked oxidase n=1 Tax=Streptacidiphilus pinicola TaxID=2219663 RepID=A0A2X0KDQ9_9ACTN|nr:FAD-dependent oxidoreductase [Streptacidiphilus pinicola]RAG87175.1 FAD-linked oxidase [Streptacidiphilus pinicola]
MTTDTAADLALAMSGELFGPADPGYDEARKIANGDHDLHPALVARCFGPEDVVAALAHARQHGLRVAVRGGGHSTAGYSSCDGGLVIDTGPMKEVAIDPGARTGRFGAGLSWAEFDAATQEYGLAVTGGRVSDTGVAGLTLGSGSGWLERMYGPSAASLVSAQVVTADGRTVETDAEQHPELLWGLRGGGGNFGVVTRFGFRLHPVGPIVQGGMILHPASAARALTRYYRDFMAEAPDEVGGGLAMITAPPAPFVPERARGQLACALVLLYVGDPDEGERALRPLVDWGDPWVTQVQPMPYSVLQQLLDEGSPRGIGEYFKVDALRALPDEAIDAFVDHAEKVTSPLTQLVLCPMGGAMSRLDRASMALNPPDAPWLYFCLSMWWGSDGRERHVAWARSFMDLMRPWSAGGATVPNFIAADDGRGRLLTSFGPEKYARLVALKDVYDPDNVFSLNQNIPPSRLI